MSEKYEILLGTRLDTSGIKTQIDNIKVDSIKLKVEIEPINFSGLSNNIKNINQVGKQIGINLNNSIKRSLNVDDVINKTLNKFSKLNNGKSNKLFENKFKSVAPILKGNIELLNGFNNAIDNIGSAQGIRELINILREFGRETTSVEDTLKGFFNVISGQFETSIQPVQKFDDTVHRMVKTLKKCFNESMGNQISGKNAFDWLLQNGTKAEKQLFRVEEGFESFKAVLRGLAVNSHNIVDYSDTLGLDVLNLQIDKANNLLKQQKNIRKQFEDEQTELVAVRNKLSETFNINISDNEPMTATLQQLEAIIDVCPQAQKYIDKIKNSLVGLSQADDEKGVSIPVNTESLEKSLREVRNVIESVQRSFNGIDGAGIGSLVANVNQIATALGKAENESDNLLKSLSALSKKDFSVNIGLDLTGTKGNAFSNNTAYGNHVIGTVIPQLQKQVDALMQPIKEKVKETNGFLWGDESYSWLLGELSKKSRYTPTRSFDLIQKEMLDGRNLSKQMSAHREFINMIQEVGRASGVDLSGIASGFSQTSDEIIQGALDIQAGVNNAVEKTEESIDRFKQIFSGGIGAENLTAELEPITQDLAEIRKAFESMSSLGTIDGLAASFNELSGVLDKLVANITLAKNALNDGLSGSSVDTSAINKIEQASDESTNAVVQNENRKQQAYRETANVANQTGRLISNAAQKSIDSVSSKSISRPFEVSEDDSIRFKREMENLVGQWTNNKGQLTDLKISTSTIYDKDAGRNIEKIRQAQVTYNNELGETIKKTIALRQIGTDVSVVDGKEMVTPIEGFVEVSSQYSKTLGKTKSQTDAFVKQQKNAVSDLTNTINQLNRATIDPNRARPIKDESHLTSLKNKYDDIISSIQRMRNASNDNDFQEERNNVKTLISEYKSLRDEYRNAENVSSKMKGTDFSSGLDIAKNDLEKFKAQAKDFPQIAKTIEELDRAIAGVGDASSLNKFTDQLKVARSELAKVKAETTAANRSTNVGIDVDGLTSKIKNLQRLDSNIDSFKTEINGAEVSVESLLNDLSKVNTASDFSVVRRRFKAFEEAAQAAGIAVTEAARKIKSVDDIKIKLADTGFDGFAQEIQRAHDEVRKLKNSTPELENALRNLDRAMETVNMADEANDTKKLVAANEQYEQALKQVYSQLKLNKQAEKNANDTTSLDLKKQALSLKMKNWLRDNSAAAKEFGGAIKELQARLESCDNVQLGHISKEFDNITRQAKLAGKNTQTLGDRLRTQFQKYSAYFGIAEVFMYTEQALRDMFEQVVAIDTAMTELKKVTNETDESYSNFLTNAAKKSKDIGTTIDGLVSSTADFARLGYDFKDAQGLAEVANIYTVVGDEIEGVEGATQSLISTMAAFKDEMNGMSNSDFAMSIVDKFNEVSNNFSISSGGIGEALTRSASSLASANNTLDESIALITASNTVVQDPEVVGTALKTISMRIRGAKTEMEEAGLETEGMVESTAKLRKEMMALSGVDIMLNENTFKSTYQIMDELADKWETLSDIQQANSLPDYAEMCS